MSPGATSTCSKPLQRRGLHHVPGQPVPILDNIPSREFLPSHCQGNPTMSRENSFPINTTFLPVCMAGVHLCSAVKPIPTQDFSNTNIFPSLTTFHTEYLLYSPSAAYMEALVEQLLVSKGKGHNEVSPLSKG